MLKKGNAIMLFVFIVACIFLTPVFAVLFEKITGSPLGYGSLDIGFSHPEYFEGFFFSSAFVLTLGIIIFTGKFRYWIFATTIGLEFLLLLLIQYFELLILDVCAALIAIILGEAVLFINRRIKVGK